MHRLIGVCLDRVADQRIKAIERLSQNTVMPLQRCCGIAIERRADLGSQPHHAEILGVQDAILVVKMMHGCASRARSFLMESLTKPRRSPTDK
jgi:hypothetical protein